MEIYYLQLWYKIQILMNKDNNKIPFEMHFFIYQEQITRALEIGAQLIHKYISL